MGWCKAEVTTTIHPDGHVEATFHCPRRGGTPMCLLPSELTDDAPAGTDPSAMQRGLQNGWRDGCDAYYEGMGTGLRITENISRLPETPSAPKHGDNVVPFRKPKG